MAIAPSKLGRLVAPLLDQDEELTKKLRDLGLIRPWVSDEKMAKVFRTAREEDAALPDGERQFNTPAERVRVFLKPYLSRKGRKWAVPLDSLKLPDDDEQGGHRPWWKFWN